MQWHARICRQGIEIKTGNHMKIKIAAACAVFFAANLAMAQSAKMQDPDILGIKPGMAKADALAAIKDKYQKSAATIVTKEVMLSGMDLMYEAQYKIKLTKSRPAIADDTLTISFLPDDTVIGIGRTISYVPNKQTTTDIIIALKEKYGDQVYFVYDDTTIFADQMMWSDRMLPGLSLVGMNYVQGGPLTSDFGTTQPYPTCWQQMLQYTSERYDPKNLHDYFTDRSHVGIDTANKWKACGKAMWAHNDHEHRLTFNATRTELLLVDLSRAPDLILNIPAMVKNNPKATKLVPGTLPTKASAGTPAF